MQHKVGNQISRRALAMGALAGGVSLAFSVAGHAAGDPGPESTWLDVHQFGAKGDGKSIDTAAIQAAIDAASEKKAAVFFPPGQYLSSEIHARPHVSLIGIPAWDYQGGAGSTIKLADSKASCLLNITNARGATVAGLAIEGDRLGQSIHGIFLNKPDYGPHEDTFRIERCQVNRFSGDGVRLTRAWCFSIRHSMIARNQGDGVRLRGWDGFLLDNWLSGNRGAGFAARDENAAITMTGNRIEWNHEGIFIVGGHGYNITGNFLDRNGACGILLIAGHAETCSQMAISGNYFHISGKNASPATDDSCQIRMEDSQGVTCVGNVLHIGRNDEKGTWSPSYGIVYKKLANCVIANNVLHQGAIKELLVDLGGHGNGLVVKDNPGSLFNPGEEPDD